MFPIGSDHIDGTAFHFPSAERCSCSQGSEVVRNASVFKVPVGNEVGCVAITIVADKNIVSISTIKLIVSTTADERVIVDCNKTDVVKRRPNGIRAPDFNKSERVGTVA